MKGITPVISVILLLLISIAMIGFAVTWFFRTSQNWENTTQTDMDWRMRTMATKVRIDTIDSISGYFTIKNTGTIAINKNQVSVYVDDVMISCPSNAAWPNELQPGDTATCTNAQIIGCEKIKITTVGSPDIATC